jgi:hypothetical protein
MDYNDLVPVEVRMPEPEPADKTTFKRWADWLWPLGGTVLGLLVMPLAIEQYPDFFDRNTWLLPFSLIVVILCWTIPFIVHKNSKRLYLLISSVPRVGSFLAPLLTVGCLALFAFGCFHLFRFHREHLVGALQKEQAGPVRVEVQQGQRQADLAKTIPRPQSTGENAASKDKSQAKPTDVAQANKKATEIPHENTTLPATRENKQPKKHTTSKKPPSEQTTPTALVNSIIENSGKLQGSEISGSEVTAPPNGTATVLRNLPGAEASNVTIQNSHVSSAPVSSPKSGGDDIKHGGILLTNSNDNVIADNVVCGYSSAIQTKESNTGNVFSGNSLNDPTRCNWLTFLQTALQHIGDITTFMDNWETVMEQSWTNLPMEKRDSNRAELAAIKKQIIASAGSRRDFVSLIVLLGPTPPSFEVKQP